jgi:hypothetical protein
MAKTYGGPLKSQRDVKSSSGRGVEFEWINIAVWEKTACSS